MKGVVGARKSPRAKKQRVKSPGQVCSQFCIVHDSTDLLEGICSEM